MKTKWEASKRKLESNDDEKKEIFRRKDRDRVQLVIRK